LLKFVLKTYRFIYKNRKRKGKSGKHNKIYWNYIKFFVLQIDSTVLQNNKQQNNGATLLGTHY